MDALKRATLSFGCFWWELLVGENPDAFIGALVIIGAALLLRHERVAAISVILTLAVLILVGSTYRGRKRASE
jgi:ABC-type spermidine/putrescine transport system permease subunit I